MSSTSVRQPNDWWAAFIAANPIPSQSLDVFRSIQWTGKYLEDPAYEPVPVFSRTLKDSGEDFFFAKTVNTPETIPHFICIRRKDFVTPDVAQPTSEPAAAVIRKTAFVPPEKPECLFLLQIAPKGLDGHPTVCHGGMCCAILDETMGFNIVLHVYNLDGPQRKHFAYTVNLNTTYRAPVPTDSELIVRTWLVKRDGRKWTLRGQIVDKNDTVCTEAEGTWILVPEQKL